MKMGSFATLSAACASKTSSQIQMTKANVDQILERLGRIESDLAEIKVELAETRGAYRLAKFVIALLGVSGLGGLIAWINGSKP